MGVVAVELTVQRGGHLEQFAGQARTHQEIRRVAAATRAAEEERRHYLNLDQLYTGRRAACSNRFCRDTVISAVTSKMLAVSDLGRPHVAM